MLTTKKYMIKDGRLKIMSLCTMKLHSVCRNKKVRYTNKWSGNFLQNSLL